MNILVLTHRLPFPPDRGDRIRSYHLLQFLAKRADVYLACVSDEPASAEALRQLSRLCQRVAVCPTTGIGRALRSIWSLAQGRSATEGYFWQPRLARTVRDWIEHLKFDAVISYCSGMYPYTLPAQDVDIPVLVDLVDVDSQKWFDYAARAGWPARWLYRTEGHRVRRLERALCERCDAVTVVSAAEASLLREFCRQDTVHSVPNGVDSEFFQPQYDDDDRKSEQAPTTARQECVFVGALDYGANVDGVTWFCRDVWPQVHARFPHARFLLVGRNPVSQVRRLATFPGVDLIGEVPDVRPYLHRACLAVVPLRIARGIQNKVLEALAAGKAVIASPQALEGLDLVPGEHVYRAADSAAWVAGISVLFSDDMERCRLGAAGRAFVCERHQWESCMRPLEALLNMSEQVTERRLSATYG